MVIWKRMKRSFFEPEAEAGAWILMRIGRTIDSKTRVANRECANERSAWANRSG
jgi:hypothetical protein